MLTKRQKELLDFLRAYIAEHGYAPTLDEIGRHFALGSLATVHKHLTNLERKGRIRRLANHSRALELTEAPAAGAAVAVPLLGRVAAGAPIEAVEVPETVTLPEELLGRGETFALRVHGDSMIGEGILDGAEVDGIRRRLWSDYGTTLHGLMHRRGIDPADYLRFVHAIELGELLAADPALVVVLGRIPLLKVAVTNGSAAHARGVLDCLGVRSLFFRVYGLERLAFVPKPYVQAYQMVLADLHALGRDCILVEDRAVNLRAARQLGMRTVYVADGGPPAPEADVSIGSVLELEWAVAALA